MFFYDESLLITHPEIAAEWSEKNYPLKPSDVTAGCHERVWWKGKCGHEWKTGIGNRTFKAYILNSTMLIAPLNGQFTITGKKMRNFSVMK